jgi:hypothetical protein
VRGLGIANLRRLSEWLIARSLYGAYIGLVERVEQEQEGEEGQEERVELQQRSRVQARGCVVLLIIVVIKHGAC